MTTVTDLSIRPVTTAIGAEVGGVDLREPLAPEVVARLRQALLDHLVLFFRDQDITQADHLRFAGSFGPVMPSTNPRVTDQMPGMNTLDQVAPKNQATDRWHTDHMFMPEPALGTVLRAVQSPSVGGDTCFLSMFAAYDDLTPAMKLFIDGLTAINTPAKVVAVMQGVEQQYQKDLTASMPDPSVHPIVRVHPESGRRALFVSPSYTARIVELSESESNATLAALFEHMQKPDFQCRFRWQDDSIAFWDNRAVQHYAVPDYAERRIMNRCLIAGDRPFGPTRPASTNSLQ